MLQLYKHTRSYQIIVAWMSAFAVLISADHVPAVGAEPPAAWRQLIIEADELHNRLRAGQKIVLLDVRKPEQFTAGHLPGAQRIDVVAWTEAFGHGDDVATWNLLVGNLGIDSQSEIVVYDEATGPAAAKAWWYLRYWGVTKVRVVNGGWMAIAASSIKPVTATSPTPTPVAYAAKVSPQRFTNKADLLAHVSDQSWQVIDARSVEEFRGEKQTDRLSRPGTLPQAIHLEWTELTDKQSGKLKSYAELRAKLAEKQIDLERPLITFSNGQGRSSISAFILEAAGGREVRVYYGGLKEWAKDASAPVIGSNAAKATSEAAK